MKLQSKLFYSYLAFLIIYIVVTLVPQPAKATLAQYHVSVLGLRLIYLTIIILLAAIWFAGFYGYDKLRTYTRTIGRSKDGNHIATISQGLFLLVMWLPVTSVVSGVLNYIASKHPGLLTAVTIFNNYLSLAVPLAGFILISLGAHRLSKLARQRSAYTVINILALFLTYVGLIFFRLVTGTHDRDMVYHLSIWLILLTLIAPYVYMWFVGLLATYEIYSYRLRVAGIVYRKSWSLLALGIGWLIVMSIALQFLTTLLARLNNLSIYWLVVIVYSVLIVLSVGFVLIAIGTRKLQRIEEV